MHTPLPIPQQLPLARLAWSRPLVARGVGNSDTALVGRSGSARGFVAHRPADRRWQQNTDHNKHGVANLHMILMYSNFLPILVRYRMDMQV